MINKSERNYNSNGRDTGGRPGPSDAPSWIGIIICLFAFWPLGLFLLIGKMRSSAAHTDASGHGRQETHRRDGARQDGTRSPTATENGAAAARRDAPAKGDGERKAAGGGVSGAGGKKRKNAKAAGRQDSPTSAILLFMGIALLAAGLALFLPPLGEAISTGSGLRGLGRGYIIEALLGVFFGVGGALTLFSRGLWRRRMSKFRKYAAVIGERATMPISGIAAAAGFSDNAVRRDVQAMIDGGWFESDSYIDDGLGCFARSSEAAQALRRETEDAAASVSAVSGENEYMKIIVELRALNETIIDIAISDKIDRIETLTAKIFRAVEDDPSKLPQIRRFMSYYLPTTLKLLRSYSTLERQGEQGENISAAKESINGILDTLAVGFEQQLDKLFRSDAIDITADVNVLEKMMASDGLTEGVLLSRGAGAVASKPAP
jgi:hypothetical protein